MNNNIIEINESDNNINNIENTLNNISNEISERICVVCLEDNNELLIEYNHCGKYYIHDKCLNEWNNLNECIICRNSLIEQDSNRDSISENNIVTILIESSNDTIILSNDSIIKKCFIAFLPLCAFGSLMYIFFYYIIYY